MDRPWSSRYRKQWPQMILPRPVTASTGIILPGALTLQSYQIHEPAGVLREDRPEEPERDKSLARTGIDYRDRPHRQATQILVVLSPLSAMSKGGPDAETVEERNQGRGRQAPELVIESQLKV